LFFENIEKKVNFTALIKPVVYKFVIIMDKDLRFILDKEMKV